MISKITLSIGPKPEKSRKFRISLLGFKFKISPHIYIIIMRIVSKFEQKQIYSVFYVYVKSKVFACTRFDRENERVMQILTESLSSDSLLDFFWGGGQP